jgi:queuine tRNA-ribosyltransferase
VLAIRNARHREALGPPEPGCDCPTCGRFSRAYLRHLFLSGESLGPRLASLHNLRFYLRLLERARAAVTAGSFTRFQQAFRAEACGPLPEGA